MYCYGGWRGGSGIKCLPYHAQVGVRISGTHRKDGRGSPPVIPVLWRQRQQIKSRADWLAQELIWLALVSVRLPKSIKFRMIQEDTLHQSLATNTYMASVLHTITPTQIQTRVYTHIKCLLL